MKYYLSLIFTFFFLVGFLTAQSADTSESKSASGQKKSEQAVQKVKEKQDDTKESERKSQQKEKESVKLEGFIDLNGNGIDDRLEGKQKGKGKGKMQNKDRFIDLDGDGICDGKESALGLRKVYRKRKGKSGGK